MKSDYTGYLVHCLICTNGGEKPGKCFAKGSLQLLNETKNLVNQLGLKTEIRVNSSGCLGTCEKGISAVIYPQNIWLLNQAQTDQDKVFETIQTEYNLAKNRK